MGVDGGEWGFPSLRARETFDFCFFHTKRVCTTRTRKNKKMQYRHGLELANPHLPPSTPILAALVGSSRLQPPAWARLVGAIDQQLVPGADAVEVGLEP